jgi:hypothetical protein
VHLHRQPEPPRQDHEQARKAREAAEALFNFARLAARPEPSLPTDGAPPVRTPRIIGVLPRMPAAEPQPQPQASPEPPERPARKPVKKRQASRIPAAQHGRIRALTDYGMTLEEVAELYEVPLGEIERIAAGRGGGTAGA